MYRLCLFFSILLLLSGTACKADVSKEMDIHDIPKENNTSEEVEKKDARLKEKADTAAIYCKKNNYETSFCILIDMKIHSGKDRIFVWDFQKDTVMLSGLCCHGVGLESTQAKPVFSNVSGSYCTSLGKYKIGIPSYSQYGIHIHYKLHGLDPTNSNAYKRMVVFHSHTPVPNYEIYPHHLPLGYSLGCPVICNELMKTIDGMLKEAKKPVLLWIYY